MFITWLADYIPYEQNTFSPDNLTAIHLSFNVSAIYLVIYYINQMEKEMATHCSYLFLTGELHRQRSLASYSLRGCKGLDTTEQLTYTHMYVCMKV